MSEMDEFPEMTDEEAQEFMDAKMACAMTFMMEMAAPTRKVEVAEQSKGEKPQ